MNEFEDDDPPVLSVDIFGWGVWRVFRDEQKNILKIVLKKDDIFKEFELVV